VRRSMEKYKGITDQLIEVDNGKSELKVEIVTKKNADVYYQ
jgi:hypothetical protein